MTLRNIILFAVLMTLAWLVDWLAKGANIFAVILARASRFCKRLSGDKTSPQYGDRVIVVSWHTPFPVGSVGHIAGDAINNNTQRLEYRVLIGTRFKWIPATAIARTNNQTED